MPPSDPQFEQDEYRIILLRSGSSAIWAERNQGTVYLPRVAVLKRRRLSQQLQEIIESAWNIHVIVLDCLPPHLGAPPCVVVEVVSSESPLHLTATSMDEISEEDLCMDEREAIRATLTADGSTCGPFSSLGWIKEAIEWLGAEVGKEVPSTSGVRQYNASPTFALARFAMDDGSAYWLKATGEPNVHEFLITRKLSEVCPGYLPPLIAAREDWNAWLMEDAGQPLDSSDSQAHERAVLSMAGLQKRTLDRTSEFLALGAFDQRVGTLRAHLSELMDYLQTAMAKQTSTKVQRLNKRQLSQLESTLRDTCFRMEELDIPNTLVLNDSNAGNILFKGSRCMFTDWCEAGVSNPFFGFEYLCLLQPGTGGEGRRLELQESYRQSWRERLSSPQIDAAFNLSRPLAILSHFYRNGAWLYSSRRDEPRVESYARSLARHMHYAIQSSSPPEASCR
jgi:hypothetical protein